MVLVTGAAGFIGSHLSHRLLEAGKEVTGFDNINSYYETSLKEARLADLERHKNFRFMLGDLADKEAVGRLFEACKPSVVIHLAAQAGVRYSIENPQAYIDSNITGFFNILEACRNNRIERLVFASSSSVYGNQQKTPFSETDNVDHPVSLYAATKKSNELMAFTYSHLYGINAAGLRFFTVYGPYGRPDMAYFDFTKRILGNIPIKVFNNGDLYRDFTYIDDIVDGITALMEKPSEPFKIYNLGNNKPVKLLTFITTLEDALGKKAIKEFLPMQAGDVLQTCADIEEARRDFGFEPKTEIGVGLKRFVEWYRGYYKV
ncbi:MAG: SDR family NAD(P)-dependent oxidoreductase [Clostridiales bacterium]|jgi:UDP-glucuronate 4-epimerase|nr:SDR family NAD(P)-dependent oxidoreductase [Clostridiales bacterium]